MMNETIYVTGHRHPDSDAICAALTYANLLRLQGKDAMALRQGPVNDETKFILKRFNQENPLLMTDARMTLADIDLDRPAIIHVGETVHHAWHVMLHAKNRSLFVLDENNMLAGVCTTSNLSEVRLTPSRNQAELMSHATLENIARTVGGRIVCRPEIFKTNGVVHIITLEGREATMFSLEGGISVLSSGSEKQLMLIKEGVKCLVITCGETARKDVVDLAKQYGCAIVETPEDTMHTAQVINESYGVEYIMRKEVITFQEDEYVEDVASKMAKTRVRCYPVMNAAGDVVGAVSRYHMRDYPHRKLVLVDHSAVNQSIGHVLEADIQEIIDHHHVGDIQTDHPINYRGVRCGCTCTIISEMYHELGFEPDPDMAGLMMSAILSDTLHFKSATTTERDKKAVEWLAKTAGVEDVSAYAAEMLGSSVSLKTSTPHEILNRDLKSFEINKYRFAIGQTNYSHLEDVQAILPAFRENMEKEQTENKLDLMVMLFTHVLGEGSLFVFYGPLSYVISDLIETKFDDHSGFDPKIISRKQQLMPYLSKTIKEL
ncbi:MAG: putative manganese-dependent inorganic diphosphatase [Solobacterium sp.]|nr:putative manganese-dependent inorganic diphosphatase [Solobacterium sp.]